MKSFILGLGLITGCNAAASETLTLPKDARQIAIYGEIGGDIIESAKAVRQFSKESKDDIYLLINSPGGAVMPGMIFVDAMKAAQSRGVKFKCVTTVMAASMAYVIYSQCDERYAFANARLLFHPMSIATSGSRVQEIAAELAQTSEEEFAMMEDLRAKLGLDWKTFHTNYFAETFWQAKRLKAISPNFLTIITDVEGFKEDVHKFQKPRMLFDMLEKVKEVLIRFKGHDDEAENTTGCKSTTPTTQPRQRN